MEGDGDALIGIVCYGALHEEDGRVCVDVDAQAVPINCVVKRVGRTTQSYPQPDFIVFNCTLDHVGA